MADNVISDPGSGGATFASDDIGGVQFPRVKLVHGADGSNDGDVSTANPLPVDIREVAGAAIPTGGGVESGAVRVTVANDSTGVLSVDDNGASLTVDGTVTAELSAVDNAVLDAIATDAAAIEVLLGTIDADTSTLAGAVSGTEMQVDVVSSALPSGASTAAKQPALGTAGTPSADVITVQGVTSMTPLTVDLGANNDVTVTGSVTANAGTNLNTSALALETGGNLAAIATDAAAIEVLLGTIDADTGNIATAASAIQTAVETIDNAISGTEMQVDVVAALPAGTNTIGDVGIAPRTTGGCSIFRSIDLDETEEEIKATAGQVYGMIVFNLTAAVLYLKFYNATAANVTVGTTTPVMTIPIPSPGDTSGAGFVFNLPQGAAFSTAITAAVTTGLADADTGAPGANSAIVQVFYA